MDDVATLERKLAAARKTIAALMRRVEAKVGAGESALATMEQTIALERVVAEKTRELDARRRQLQETVIHLQQAQTELMQAQKLESVGRLASGIAHEINTPIQFVSDSVLFVRDAWSELSPLLRGYADLTAAARAGAVDAGLLARVEEAERAADLAYLVENVPRSVDRCVEGLARLATLVRSMKEFAHPEQKQKASADLNRALATTLTIARNEYKYVADVETDFGDIPLVLCHVGELNQVFLNIIVNAAHAIEAMVRGTDARGLIRVQTRREGDQVRISISDTGGGIPEAIRDRIFDPFFTTKEVGKGTGQGLAIARSVVIDKHRGSLTFDTDVGRGTTFHILLPHGEAAGEDVGDASGQAGP